MGLFKRASTGATPVRANRSKWKRRLLAALVVLLLLLILSPRIIAHTPLRNWLLARALPRLQGDIHVGAAALGWFWHPVFTDIEVHDNAGRTLLRIPRLEGSKSLAAILCHPFDLGEFRLTQPAVHVVCSRDSSNLETALAYWLQMKELPSGSWIALKGVAFRVVLKQASIVLEDEDNGSKWSLDPLDLTVAIPRNRRTPVRLELNATAADALRAGRLNAVLSAHYVEKTGDVPRLLVEGELNANALPLDAAEPFLRRLQTHLKLGGWLNANLKLSPSNGQSGSPDMRLEGSVSIQALALSGSLLGADILRLQRAEMPLRMALEGSRLTIERLEMQSEVGKICLAGSMDLAKEPRDALLQPGHRVEAELNLARLAELVPNALHLTKETRMQSGTLSLHLSSALREDSLLWEGDLHTSDLEGLYQGQRITWKEPFAVVLTAHQEMNDPLPVFERIRCDSDFLRLEMSGSPKEWTARGSFNLGRLCEHLAGFVEMGSLRVQGQGTLRAAARRNLRGYRLESDVGLTQFSLADGGRAWREDCLTIHLDLIGENAGGYRINAGALHVLSGKDGIDLDLLEPIGDVESFHAVRARLRFHGDLARWQGRVTSLTGMLAGVSLAGQIDVDGRLRYEAETIQLEDVKLAGRAVQFQGFGVSVEEPTLDFTTSGRWLPDRETLELQHTRLSCPTVTVQAPSVTLGSDPVGAWQITAGATVQGDLARLLRIPCLRGGLVGGAVAGRIDLRPDEGRQIVQCDVNVQDLVFGSPSAPVWRESRVNLVGHGVYDVVKDSVRIVHLHLDSPALSCDAAGQLNALSSDMELSLEGKLGYDLEKLEPHLRPYLGQGVKLSGRDARPFHIAGPLVGQAFQPDGSAGKPDPPARWHGDAALSWQTLQALGCQIGPAELRSQLSGGWLRLAPVETTLNLGRLRLEPSLRLDPLPLEVMLAKGRAIEHAHLTPAACASVLGYAVPILAGVAQADGEFSLDLQGGRVPLVEAEKGDILGWITLHSAQISAGPLVQELSVLLKGPATPTLAKDNVVPFRMINGRVHHTGLELHFPELTMRVSGSVGLDGSLALTAEMPVPPKWLVSSKLAKSALAKQTIRLPIGGTLSQPKIDERALREASAPFMHDTTENTLRQESDGKAKKESESGLRKLFRRK
ncbi:MAG: translocation/assembly module TamB domain-containing protein [Gemmataceae bacterium]